MQWVLQICGTQIHCLGSGVWLLSWLHIPRLHTETWVCDKVPPVGPASRYMLCGTFLYNGGWCLLNSTGFEKKIDCQISFQFVSTMFFHKIERHLPKFNKFEFRYHSKFFPKKNNTHLPTISSLIQQQPIWPRRIGSSKAMTSLGFSEHLRRVFCLKTWDPKQLETNIDDSLGWEL